MYVISHVRAHTLGFVCRSFLARSLMEGLVDCIIMILQIWLGAMNVRKVKAAPTVIHLAVKYRDYLETLFTTACS